MEAEKRDPANEVGFELITYQEFTCETKWHHAISVLQTAESQKCYHVTRMFEPQIKTNGP